MKKAIAFIVVLLFSLALPMDSTPRSMAQSVGNVIINADGSVTGTNNIQRTGSTYTLTGNVSGTIQVQKSNIIIDGAGYALTGEGGVDLTNDVQHDPTRPVISNVTIENLYIVNGGIGTNGGGYDTFYNDYISNSIGYCIFLMGNCDYNNITFCTIKGSNDTAAIGIVYGANYNGTITENNITGGIMMWLSEGGTVDRNYWSDYLAKYPNASEVDSSGIGNTPYVFSTAQNGSETIYYQDNHPLMKPVSSTIPEFPSAIIFAAFITATLIAVLVYSQKSKR
jgi:hypothetical protein